MWKNNVTLSIGYCWYVKELTWCSEGRDDVITRWSRICGLRHRPATSVKGNNLFVARRPVTVGWRRPVGPPAPLLRPAGSGRAGPPRLAQPTDYGVSVGWWWPSALQCTMLWQLYVTATRRVRSCKTSTYQTVHGKVSKRRNMQRTTSDSTWYINIYTIELSGEDPWHSRSLVSHVNQLSLNPRSHQRYM